MIALEIPGTPIPAVAIEAPKPGTDPLRFGPGDLLAGRFEIEEQLGRDGTRGYALAATDRLTTQKVVCKVPIGDLVEGRDALLKQYAKLRLIRSYSVVQALGYFEHATSGGNVPILVLERLTGTTLREWQPSRSLRERLGAIEQVVRTLAEMARVGLAHGDVHLDNALIEKNQVVLIDPDAESFGSVSRVVPLPVQAGTPVDFPPLRYLVRDLIPDLEQLRDIEPLLASLAKPDDIAGVLDALPPTQARW